MAIKAVDLADPWALRELTICVRDFEALPPYRAPTRRAHARRRVELAAPIGPMAAGTPTRSSWLYLAGYPATEISHAYSEAVGTGRRRRAAGCGRLDARQPPPKWPTPSSRTSSGKAVGDVDLMQTPAGVLLKLTVKGLPPGEHAFHIHAVGKCEAPFESAGPHFNPGNTSTA